MVRLLDRRLGPWLCRILSVWDKLTRGLCRPRSGAGRDIRKVVFVKLSELGAVICAYPLMKRIKDTYPKADLFFVTFEQNREVFDLLGGLIPPENVLTVRMDSPRAFLGDSLRVCRYLSRQKLDAAFDLEFFSRSSAILTYLSGAARRIGFFGYTFEGLYRGALLTHRIQYNPLSHISRSYYSLSAVLSLEGKKTPELGEQVPAEALTLPQYVPDGEMLDSMQDVLRKAGVMPGHKILLLHIGDGCLSLREWPFTHFEVLVRQLLIDTNVFLVFVGSQSDDRQIDKMQSLEPQRCLNLNRRTKLRELMALFHLADALFSNDCGLVHLAALSRINKFILYGPESPRVFAPLGPRTHIIYSDLPCSPCFSAFNHRTSTCRDNICLKMIDPQEVARAITDSL